MDETQKTTEQQNVNVDPLVSGLLDLCRDPLAKDLLPCANCGANPEFDCKIHVSHGNYDLNFMQSASAQCVRGGSQNHNALDYQEVVEFTH